MRKFWWIYLLQACMMLNAQNALQITSTTGEPFTLLIDGSAVNTEPQAIVRADAIKGDTVTVKIFGGISCAQVA